MRRMFSVPSPAASTCWRKMTAIASDPSAITVTRETSTKSPPSTSTTAGRIPGMRFLQGGYSGVGPTTHVRERAGVYARCVRQHTAGVTRLTPRSPGLGSRQGSVRRGVDREDLGEARDPEDLEQAVLVADELEGTVVGADLLEAAHEHTEPGRVEELHALHVDDDVVAARGDQLGDGVAQLRRGVDVDLPTHCHDGAPIDLARRKCQVHVSIPAIAVSSSTSNHDRPNRARARALSDHPPRVRLVSGRARTMEP